MSFDHWQAHQNEVTSVVFSTDGAVLYSVSKDKSIIVWDAKRTWAVRHVYREAHDDWINSIAVSPNGRYAVTGWLHHALPMQSLTSPQLPMTSK